MSDAQPQLQWLCIDFAAVTNVDYSAAETQKSLFTLLEEHQIRLVVAQATVDADPNDRLELQRHFGEDAFYNSLDDLVEAYLQETP